MSKTAKVIFGVVLVVVVALALYFLINSLVGPTAVDFSEFVTRVQTYVNENGAEGLAVVINPSTLVYTMVVNGSSVYYAYGPSTSSGDNLAAVKTEAVPISQQGMPISIRAATCPI